MKWIVKDVVKQTGIPADTLRYYDKMKILSPKRGPNKYRYYDDSDIAKLQYITVMKYAHFNLDEIKILVERLDFEPSAKCNELCRNLFQARKKYLESTVVNYQRIIGLIENFLSMAENAEQYYDNQSKIETLVNTIYEDICKEREEQ